MANNNSAPALADEAEWYRLSTEDTFKGLRADESGLSSIEAKARLEKFGYNEIKFKKRGPITRFLLQFHNPLIYVLLAAALVTGILTITGEDMLGDTVVIVGVVILNVIIGFIQEGKGEAAIEALQRMMVPECTVVRDEQKRIIPSREVVPGDVVILEGGDKIPADLRLFTVKNLHTDEAALTGESVPVAKYESPISRPDLPPGDQRNIAFSGTFATRGRAVGIVVATGEHTEFGKIAKLMKETRQTTTPLMRKIAAFTRFLIIAVLILATINFVAQVIFDYPLVYSFMASVSLAVAAIPEMLPAILAAILALAAVAMSKRNALIRKLPAAETLGVVTVICSDKTGTLTKNQMTVVRIYAGGKDYNVSGVGYEPDGEFVLEGHSINPANAHRGLLETLNAGFQCNDASLVTEREEPVIIGDPTEGALIVSAAKAGISQRGKRLDEIPFESEQQYMATLNEGQDENYIYIKGSPERILRMCHSQLTEDHTGPLKRSEVLAEADGMASEALRVLGIAYKPVPKTQTSLSSDDLAGLTLLGLQGMIDPPREEAIEAIRKSKRAGIRPIMITGDHAQTALAIARQLGITSDGVVTGEEMARMSDDELYETVDRVSIYARVAPEHKLRITQQLQKRGQITAVTGDGVNDAPALKAADIGIAMGITGTEVSKEAADMVLADDNFASIVNAVEEGRHAWKNLEKAILYTLPTNGGQALLVMGAVLLAPVVVLFSLRLPLEPIQILWVNLFDSVFLTMPLMMEPREKGLLDAPPRSPKEKIANRLFFIRVGLVSVVMAGTGFIVFSYFGSPAISGPVINELLLTQAQTAALMSVVMVHVGFIFTARSTYDSAFTFSPFTNKWILWGVGITLAINLAIAYLPFLNSLFRTAPFPAEWWLLIIFALFPGFLIVEMEKLIRKRLKKS